MRHFLFVMVLVAFAPALPATAFAQDVVLAQADDEKAEDADEKTEPKAEKESAEEEAAAKASDAKEKAEAEAEKAATAESDEAKDDAPTSTAPDERIPLTANFSKAELITASSAYVAGMGLLVAGPLIFDSPDVSMDTPRVGSLDYSISSRFHGNLTDPGKFLFGVPDYLGAYIMPIGGTLFYLGSASYYWGTGDTLFGQSVNFDHKAMGFIEALGWTALATGVTKHLVGRERPYKALNRPEFAPDEERIIDAELSFFSGHTSMSFAIASYVAWDLSDYLVSQGSSFWIGRFLPFAGTYGIASIVGISRIYDQDHYFSDVMTGALVGSLIGNLVYVTHFDSDGDPRVRHPEALEDVDVSLAPISTMTGESGVGLVGNW